jgi:hypothetical protein
MKRNAGQVKEIILDVIDEREEDLREHIPSHTALEEHAFFMHLLGGDFKEARKKADHWKLRGLINEIEQAVDLKLKGVAEDNVVEEIRQYIISSIDPNITSLVRTTIVNQAKFKIKGKWNIEDALKSFSYLVTVGVKLYRKNHPHSPHIPPRLSKSIKTKAAQELLEWYIDEIEQEVDEMGGVHDILDMLAVRNPDRVFPKSLETRAKSFYYEDFLKLLRKAKKKMRFDLNVFLSYEPSPERSGYLSVEVLVANEAEDTRIPLGFSFEIKSDLKSRLEKDIERALEAVSLTT